MIRGTDEGGLKVAFTNRLVKFWSVDSRVKGPATIPDPPASTDPRASSGSLGETSPDDRHQEPDPVGEIAEDRVEAPQLVDRVPEA